VALLNFQFFEVAAAYSTLQAKGPEMKVLYSYDQGKPGAQIKMQHLGKPQLSDEHVFVGEGYCLLII